MNCQAIQPEAFVSAVQPLLEKRDLCGLISLLQQWETRQIVGLLQSSHGDARKVAALALGLVGGACVLGPLAEQLRDPDPIINEMAEHALWSIWFRSGKPQANCELNRGAKAMDSGDLEAAVQSFSRAIELDPAFAEAFNQRAIAYYLMERFDDSIRDCNSVVSLMCCHFGAWAGMGHCYAHQGQFARALDCYRKALEINPHLECVREACDELQRQQAAN